MKRILWVLAVLVSWTCAAAPEIEVKGLFSGNAVVLIDGQQRLLKVGKASPEGVTLVEANSKYAIVEVAGQRRKLTLSRKVGGTYQAPEVDELRLTSGLNGHYWVDGRINSGRTRFLVDTGASSIAMSSVEARRLGIDYSRGRLSKVGTAAGEVTAHEVTLNTVSVGPITLRNVAAVVVEGDSPSEVLLGNSFLHRVNIRIEEGKMIMKARY